MSNPLNFIPPYKVICGKNYSDGRIYAISVNASGQIEISGALNYQGVWNATTNVPALASGVGTKGRYYVVSVAGTTTLDGVSDWSIGDWAVFNGVAWQKADHTDVVSSVAGRQGVVNLYEFPSRQINGGGFAIQTGIKGYIYVYDDMTITSFAAVGDTTGAITVTIGSESCAFTLAGSPATGTHTPASPINVNKGTWMVINVTANAGSITRLDFVPVAYRR
jgi:hypothetical protein